jgi:hypothetical protein
MAEITNDKGTHILDSAIIGKVDKPLLWKTSTSKVKWPIQDNPPRTALKQWKKVLLPYTSNSQRALVTPLGNWTQHAHTQRHWKYVRHERNIIHRQQITITNYAKTQIRSRHSETYRRTNEQIYISGTDLLPVTPEIHNDTMIQ